MTVLPPAVAPCSRADIAEAKGGQLQHKMGHLACFMGGLYAISGADAPTQAIKDRYAHLGAGITETCRKGYTMTSSSFLVVFGVFWGVFWGDRHSPASFRRCERSCGSARSLRWVARWYADWHALPLALCQNWDSFLGTRTPRSDSGLRRCTSTPGTS